MCVHARERWIMRINSNLRCVLRPWLHHRYLVRLWDSAMCIQKQLNAYRCSGVLLDIYSSSWKPTGGRVSYHGQLHWSHVCLASIHHALQLHWCHMCQSPWASLATQHCSVSRLQASFWPECWPCALQAHVMHSNCIDVKCDSHHKLVLQQSTAAYLGCRLRSDLSVDPVPCKHMSCIPIALMSNVTVTISWSCNRALQRI